MEPQKTPWKIIVFTTAVFVIGGIAIYLMNFRDDTEKETAENTQINNAPEAIVPPATEENVTKSATSSWKTYTNTAIGFELEYPANWYVRETSDRVALSNFEVPGTGGFGTESDFGITTRGRGKKLSLENWFEEEVVFDELGLESKEPATINGRTAIKIKLLPAAGSWMYYYVVSGTDFIEIGFSPEQENFSKIYEHMLSTIKFTEKKEK